MRTRHHRIRHGRALLGLAAATSLLCAATGCGPEVRARQSLDAGQPVEAVRLFHEAVQQKPDDTRLRDELADARCQAAAALALDAEQTMASGHLAEAADLARRAVEFDDAFEPLLRRIETAQSRELLGAATTDLDADRYDAARSAVARAATITPDLVEVAATRQRIDEQEADALAAQALVLAGAGEFDRSRRLADRAVKLAPGRPATASLLATIDRMKREARFDDLAVDAQRQLEARTLTAAADTIARMEALGVRQDRLRPLQADLAARGQALDAALDAARGRRAAGSFAEALPFYETATALVADRPDLSAERDACTADLQFQLLTRDASLAMQQGAFDDSVRLYRAALDLKGDGATAALLREAEAAALRVRFQDAIEAGALLDAAGLMQALLRLEPDPDGEQRLARLRQELVEVTLADAAALDADGRPDEAIDVITNVLARHADPALEARLPALQVRWLLEQATEADRLGRVREARDLYLAALAKDGARPGVAARVDDAEIAAALQQRAEAAESEAASLEQTAESLSRDLATRERAINGMLQDLRDCEQKIDDLGRANSDLANAANNLQRQLSYAERELYRIRCDNDRLRSALHAARRDADHWRRCYDRERRRREP